VVERANDGITIIQDGVVKFVNYKLAEMWGGTVGEILSSPFTEYIYPSELQKVADRYHRRIAGEDLPSIYETALRRRDGSKAYVELNAGLIMFQGKPANLVIVRDITERKRAKEALIESRKRFQDIVENISDWIWEVDDQGRYTYVSPVVEEVLGYKPEEMLGRFFYEFFLPEDQLFLKEAALCVFSQQEIFKNFENRKLHKNGRVVVLETSGVPLIGEDSRLLGYRGADCDITERKMAEKALRASEERYRLLVESSNEAIIVAQDDMLKYVNPKMVEITGLSEEELISRPFVEFIHPEDREMVIDRYLRRLRGEEPTAIYAFRIGEEGGMTRWIEINPELIEWEGRPATLNFLSDVTERKQAEENLKKSEDRYRTIFENAPVGIFQTTLPGRFLNANPALAKMFGFASPDEMIVDITDLGTQIYARSEDREHLKRLIAEKGFVENFEVEGRKRDSQSIWVSINIHAVRDRNGTILYLEGTNIDITERKRAETALHKAHAELELRVKERTEELERRAAEMERFIYTVSHDLRSPLITVSGFVGFLKKDLEIGDAKRIETDLRLIEEAITRMDALLGDTLELSRIGRVMNPPENVPFGEIVKEALDQMAEKLGSKAVAVSVAQDLPVANVDRMRIVEVLVNLIENSVRYMGDQPEPKIAVGHRLDGAETVFFVRDNGIGIDPSQHEKVFELFYKVDKKSEGTGAGLAIIKRIIEVHGGRIWIESKLEKGCTVCFMLPLA
jgi:PAS domain S-box-containing protein